MEKTKKSIFSKIFVCLSLCLVLLGALAPCFSMNNNQPLKAESYEDGPVQFVGSEVWFPYDFYVTNSIFDNNVSFYDIIFDYSVSRSGNSLIGVDPFVSDWLTYNFKLSFSIDENNQLYINYPFSFSNSSTSSNYYFVRGSASYVDSNRILISSISDNDVYFMYQLNTSYSVVVKTYFVFDNLFDYTNVLSVSIYSGSNSGGNYVYIDYRDANNYSLRCAIYVANNFNYERRTYYFSNAIDLTDNEYYNQGYNAGQNDGYNNGYNAGENDGYNNGYKAGNTIGFENGYNKGVNDSNQYTFVNLIGATIDAPMQYFKSLFNFELLGVNLSSFLMGLFTLCIIVTILKLCLGR